MRAVGPASSNRTRKLGAARRGGLGRRVDARVLGAGRHPRSAGAGRFGQPSSVSMVTRRVALVRCGLAVQPDPHDRSASNTTRPTTSGSSSSAAWVRASSSWWRTSASDPARAPLAVPGLGRAVGLDRHVVRVDLGRDAVEQDPPLAPDGRGDRRAAPGQQARGDRLDDRAADLAADLLAAIGDLERDRQDRLGAARSTAGTSGRTGSGTSGARPPGRSARRSSRPGRGRARPDRRRRAGPRPGRRAGPPGSPRRRRPGRRGRHPGSAPRSARLAEGEQDDLGERRQPVDRAVRVGRSPRSRRGPRRPRRSTAGPAGSSPRAVGDLGQPGRPRRVEVVDVRPLVLDLLAEVGQADAGPRCAVERGHGSGTLSGLMAAA